MLGVMVGDGATGGIVVTSGEFTEEARAFARAINIMLLSGKELHKSMKSFMGFEDQPKRKTGWNLQKVQFALMALLVVEICSIFLNPGKIGRSFYSILPAFLSDGQKHRYEIELFSGGWIYTDNARITDKEVTYKSDNVIMIRVGVGGDKTEGNGIIGCFLDLSAGENAGCIAIKKAKTIEC